MKSEAKFWSSIFLKLCFRGVLNLKQEGGKKVQIFFYGFKNFVKLGVGLRKFKISICRTIFRKLTPNLTITMRELGQILVGALFKYKTFF